MVVKKPIIFVGQFGSNLPLAVVQFTLKLQRDSLNSGRSEHPATTWSDDLGRTAPSSK